jgi:hypothetical protein
VINDPSNTPAARAVRAQRSDARSSQRPDVLADRQSSVAFWKFMAETNPRFGPVWCSAFYRNNTFRDRLLPKTRAYLNERRRAALAELAADQRAYSERCRLKKALAKAPPLPLFET